MGAKVSVILRRCFWIVFVLLIGDVLYTAFYDIYLGYTDNYPEGFTWGEYTADQSSLILAVVIPVLVFIVLLIQTYFAKYFEIKTEAGKRIIPVILMIISFAIRLLVIWALGLHTYYNSDVREAVELANGSFPFDFDKFSSVSSWAVWPVYLRVVRKIFGSVIIPGLILNAVYISLSVGLMYWIVLKKSKSMRWAVISAELYIIWPMNFLFAMSLRPENVNIFLLILSLAFIVLCQEKYKKCQYKSFFVFLLLAAVMLGAAGFFKKIDLIELAAIAILGILFFLKEISRFKNNFDLKKTLFVLSTIFLFLFAYKLTVNIGYSVLDKAYVQKVNRNPTAHYIEVGLSPWSDGSYHGITDETKPIGVYAKYARKLNYDYELTSDKILQKLIREVSEEKNLDFDFFQNKLRICWSNQAYFNFISAEASEESLINRKFFRETVYPISQVWYTILLIFLLLSSIGNLCRKYDEVSFYSALFIFGFMLLMLICETQPRYKYAVYPYMAVLAGKGMMELSFYIRTVSGYLGDNVKRVKMLKKDN